MRKSTRSLVLVGLGFMIGAATATGLFLVFNSQASTHTEVGYRLLAVQDRALLLSMVDQARIEPLRTTLERSVAWELQEADKLIRAGALPWAFPAFLGESLGALDQLAAYADAHHLDRVVAVRARAIRARLLTAYERGHAGGKF